MAKQTSLNPKITKQELLESFEELQAKYRKLEQEKLAPSENSSKKHEEEVLKKTANLSQDNLEQEINNLRRRVQVSLEEIREKLLSENDKLNSVREAITIETKNLEEIYNIKLANDALHILIDEYEIKKKDLTEANRILSLSLKENIENQKKEWEREEEEYEYNLKISRKKEEEGYKSKQEKEKEEWFKKVTVKESELEEREKSLKISEVEAEEAKKQIVDFPEKLNRAVAQARKEEQTALTRDFSHEKALLEQKWEAQKGIHEVKINNLEEIIKNANTEIQSLKIALNEANKQGQILAATVVRGISNINQAKEIEQTKDKVERDNSRGGYYQKNG